MDGVRPLLYSRNRPVTALSEAGVRSSFVATTCTVIPECLGVRSSFVARRRLCRLRRQENLAGDEGEVVGICCGLVYHSRFRDWKLHVYGKA